MQKEKPHIFLLTSDFPYGKLEPYLFDELKVAEQLKLSLTIVPLFVNEMSKKEENVLGFEVLNITNDYNSSKISLTEKLILLGVHLKDLIKSGSGRYFKANYKHNYSLLLRLYYIASKLNEQIVRSNAKNIIYSYWCDNLAMVSAFVQVKNDKIKTISRAHGFDVFKEQTKCFHIPFRFFQIKWLKKIYSVSQSGVRELVKDNPDFKSKIALSRLGVFDNGINPHLPDVINIVTCSIIRNVKRLDLLAETLQNYSENLTWHIIGDGPDLEKLKSRIETLPNNIKVIFYGYLSKDELKQFYLEQPVTALVSTSRSEGIPVSMMEAISYGIPVISTAVGGCPEIVTEKTGLLISANAKAEEVRSVLNTILKSKINTVDFRKGVKEFWNENYNAEKNYSEFYNNLIEV